MRVIITVEDKRCSLGISTRSKEVSSYDEAISFVRSVKNRIGNDFTIIENSIARSERI